MRSTATHLAIIAALSALLVASIVHPFLPGAHDRLAVPLSTMAQVFGVVGLPFAVVGLVWLAAPRYQRALTGVALVVAMFVAMVLALFATLSVGISFGVLTVAAWLVVIVVVVARSWRRPDVTAGRASVAPLYLIALPAVALGTQLALAAPLTASSRVRAIQNAAPFIDDLEAYHCSHGRYPVSLQAQHGDYAPRVVGIPAYVYAPSGDSYDLAFEQPRFLLDRFGTREWVVYNPRGRPQAHSHAASRLMAGPKGTPHGGWYASGDTGHAGWRYFWFD